MTAPADAGTLTINIAFKGASQRAVWQSTLEAFHKAHPDIDVKATFVDEEAYKVQLPAWLTTVAPDVVNWHAGERMAYYAKRGLFEDLSGDWTKNGWGTMYASTRDASSYNGKQYAAPTVYYSWGCSTARTCSTRSASPTSRRRDQFLDACKRLKAAGITPIAVGGRDAWTLAGWFDYLDLRLNGNVFHQQLMAGDVPYTDPRVKKVYTTWKSLIDAGYFIDNALSYDLDGAQPFLFQGKAAMMLMGTFIAAGFPPNVKQEMGYYRFPIIDPKVPTAEDGPVESLHIPTKAKNKADAHTFLAFVETPEMGAKLAEGRLAVGQQQVARAGRSGLAYRLPDPRRYEGRRRAVLRPRHDEGNGRRGDEGDAAVPRESRAARYGARATRTDPQADLQEVTA